MNFNEIDPKLETYFETAWARRTPIQFPNRGFDPPKDAAGGEFVRFYTKFGQSAILEDCINGAGKRNGVIFCDIMISRQFGSAKKARDLAALIEPIFRKKDIDGIIIGEATSNPLDIEGFYLLSVSFPFFLIIL